MAPTAPLPAAQPGQQFALDVQDLEGLRRAARRSPEEGLRQVSRQFEALFVGMLLKSMRDATPSAGLLESQGGKMYQSLLDQQLAQKLSGRGIGLADAMFAQLRRTVAAPAGMAPPPPAEAAPMPAPALPAAASPVRTPRAAPAALPALRAFDASTSRHAGATFAPPAAAPAAASAPASAPAGIAATVQSTVAGFVERVADAARSASRASGVPAALIVAQAALESGWGRREIRGADGTPSFNLFGIKADRSWRGPVAQTTTTEYVDGAPQRVTARFRAYGSYEEAFADHAKFLAANPRYAGVLSASDPARAAHGLQRAGYATDPDYAAKLVRILRQLL